MKTLQKFLNGLNIANEIYKEVTIITNIANMKIIINKWDKGRYCMRVEEVRYYGTMSQIKELILSIA